MASADESAESLELLAVEIIALSGSKLLALELSPDTTVMQLKAAVAAGELAIPPSMQVLLLGTCVLDSDADCIGSFVADDADCPLVIQLMASDAVLRWDSAVDMELLDGGLRIRKVAGRAPSDRGSVFGAEPLPRRGRCCWKLTVEQVAFCGDVIVGLLNPDSGEAFSFVAVGDPSGMLGINTRSCNFGDSTTSFMRYQQDEYCRSFAYDGDDTVGLEVTALWCQGALSFALNGEGRGIAFKLGDGDHDLPQDSGDKLVPFVTCYGEGTTVALDPSPECEEVCLEVVKPAHAWPIGFEPMAQDQRREYVDIDLDSDES